MYPAQCGQREGGEPGALVFVVQVGWFPPGHLLFRQEIDDPSTGSPVPAPQVRAGQALSGQCHQSRLRHTVSDTERPRGDPQGYQFVVPSR